VNQAYELRWNGIIQRRCGGIGEAIQSGVITMTYQKLLIGLSASDLDSGTVSGREGVRRCRGPSTDR
jgi:hypothetical protein